MTSKTYTFDSNLISDFYKDVNGYRPSEAFWNTWKNSNDDQKQAYWDSLNYELDVVLAAEKRAHEQAQNAFELSVTEVMECGVSRNTAIRWIIESLDVDGDYGYACYKLGLPYYMESKLQSAARAS